MANASVAMATQDVELPVPAGRGGREEADKPTPADLNVVLLWDIVSKGLMIMYVC